MISILTLLVACSPIIADPIRVEASAHVDFEACRLRGDDYFSSGRFDEEIAIENVSGLKAILSTPVIEQGEDVVWASLTLTDDRLEPEEFTFAQSEWRVSCHGGVPEAGWHEFSRIVEVSSVSCDKYGRCDRLDAADLTVTLALHLG